MCVFFDIKDLLTTKPISKKWETLRSVYIFTFCSSRPSRQGLWHRLADNEYRALFKGWWKKLQIGSQPLNAT
jgi:hypothetical protein